MNFLDHIYFYFVDNDYFIIRNYDIWNILSSDLIPNRNRGNYITQMGKIMHQKYFNNKLVVRHHVGNSSNNSGG